ncbi:VOC family protein [Georgenia sp. Z1491]|uniref:VOC family protein n=1 Tax=Georgenia sp. Z1491 TaxID=3416707 RepID=UPI003CFA43B8
MVTSIATYIAFRGQTREAFEHYRDLFGGELEIITYGDMPMPGMDMPPDAVAHAVLTTDAGVLAGSDAVDDDEYPIRGSAYSFLLTFATVEEAQRVGAAMLEAGGEVQMPFELAPWGDHYGQMFDRFGVMWALNVPGEPTP